MDEEVRAGTRQQPDKPVVRGENGRASPRQRAGRGAASRVSAVVDTINEHILSGELQAGSRLPVEEELSKSLNVSRTPLREGVKILEAAGVLEVRRGVGTFVAENARTALLQFQLLETQLGKASLREMVETRFMLERTAAELAARNRTEAELAGIIAANERLKSLSQDPQTPLGEILDADIAFHLAIYAAANNRLLETLGSLVTEMFRPWIRDSLARAGGVAAARTHEPVVAMIKLGNPDAARESWTAHVVAEGIEHWRRSLETIEDRRSASRLNNKTRR